MLQVLNQANQVQVLAVEVGVPEALVEVHLAEVAVAVAEAVGKISMHFLKTSLYTKVRIIFREKR